MYYSNLLHMLLQIIDNWCCVVSSFILFLYWASSHFCLQYLVTSDDSAVNVEEELAAEVIALYVVRRENWHIRDIVIIIEGSIVLNHLGFSRACCYLLGQTYVLDLKYPKTLKYTFEVYQKTLIKVMVSDGSTLVISQQMCKDWKTMCLHSCLLGEHR